jgi:predicted GIY-YIG superfamily endonuclease
MDQHNYYVYIMSSVSRTLYTGVTNHLERRVAEHRQAPPGSFTALGGTQWSRANESARCA